MEDNLNEDFILELFKTVLSKKQFLEVVHPHLKYNFLPGEKPKELWKEIDTQYRVEEKTPTIGSLKLAFRKNRELLEFLEEIKETEVQDRFDDVLENFKGFIQQAKFVELYDKIGDIYNEGDKKKAYEIWAKGSEQLANFSIKDKLYSRVFQDYSLRYSDRLINKGKKRERIATGIDELDYIMHGGDETGEATLYLADSGGGKSILLNQRGISAARRGYKVLHVQAEGTKDQCMNRYDSAWTGSLYFDMKEANISPEKYQKHIQVVKNIGKGEIYVEAYERFGQISLVDVRNSIIELRKTFGEINLLLLDYFELFSPGDGITYKPSEERFRQEKLAQMCKNMAVEFNINVATATQASGISPDDLNNPDFVITRYNSSEFKGKLRPFDNFITINQTREEKKNKIARLYADKLREHESGQIITIKQNLNRTRFYDRKGTLEEGFFIPKD